MTESTSLRYTIRERKAIFKALADLQDELDLSIGRNPSMVRESYRQIGQRFGLSRWDLRIVEDEGIEKGWLDMDKDGTKNASERSKS